jgi:phosphatidylinositol N-acetylglucosaminyltransferase subunit A
LSEI